MRPEIKALAERVDNHMTEKMKMNSGAPWRKSNMAVMSKQIQDRAVYLQREIGELVKVAAEEQSRSAPARMIPTTRIEHEAMNIAALAMMVLDLCEER